MQHFQRPKGVAYPRWFRANVYRAKGTAVERAAMFQPISPRTVQRIDKRARDTGVVDALPHAGGRECSLHQNEAAGLAWLKMHNPPASLDEVKNFMEAVTARGLDLSLST